MLKGNSMRNSALASNSRMILTSLGKVFKFLRIPFTFQAFSKELYDVFIERIDMKIDKWITKGMTLVAKLQICTKVLVAPHVY